MYLENFETWSVAILLHDIEPQVARCYQINANVEHKPFAVSLYDCLHFSPFCLFSVRRYEYWSSKSLSRVRVSVNRYMAAGRVSYITGSSRRRDGQSEVPDGASNSLLYNMKTMLSSSPLLSTLLRRCSPPRSLNLPDPTSLG